MTSTLSALRSAAKQGETAALDMAWLLHDYFSEWLEETYIPERVAFLLSHHPNMTKGDAARQISGTIKEEEDVVTAYAQWMQLDLAAEKIGCAYKTLRDRWRVGAVWTRARVASLPHKLGYNYLRPLIGKTEKETLERTRLVMEEWEKRDFLTVEEVNDLVNGREHLKAFEKARLALVKAAERVLRHDTDSRWCYVSIQVIECKNSNKGDRNGEK